MIDERLRAFEVPMVDAMAVQSLLGPGFQLLETPEKGAYALLLDLREPIAFPWRRQTVKLDTGWYVYAGSAYGAGGIRARVRHHVRRGKRPHWHIDHLTNRAETIDVIASIGGSECEIVGRLIGSGRFHAPIAGFGSSDCRGCPAHLLRHNG